VAAIREQLDATQEEFKVGEVTRTDVSEAEARLDGAQADLAATVGQLRISRSNFEHYVGQPAMVLEQRPLLPKLPISEEAAITEALIENPAVVSAKEQQRGSSYAVDDAAGVLMPQVSIQAQYQYAHDQPNTGTDFGIGRSEHVTSVIGQISVPLYQGGAEDAGVRQAEQRNSAANLTIANTQRSVVDATKTAWEGYVAAEAVIASSRRQVQADASALDSVRQEQKVGSRTVLDVLNAEQELLNSQVSAASSERDACVAAFEVLSSTGRLTAKDLSLPVKLYDPKQYYDESHAKWFGTDDN
jgi:outer membrane protein